MKIAFHASRKLRAQNALAELKNHYTTVPPEEADVIVVLGGDGSMLHALHHYIDYQAPLFGMNLGTLGFLLNDYNIKKLQERIANAAHFTIHPLKMQVIDKNGDKSKRYLFAKDFCLVVGFFCSAMSCFFSSTRKPASLLSKSGQTVL